MADRRKKAKMSINPILLEVFKNRFSSICEEMGVALTRTSFSSNIKERRDLSCALFSRDAQMVAQAAHIPVHLGSMPLSVKAVIESIDLDDGDMVMLNDPFRGGTHLPDITLVAPVFSDGKKPVFYVANRAHHSDVGGMSSGSMPLSGSIFQEGMIIPPVKIMEKGGIRQDIMSIVLSNVRTPVEREGDFSAQIMANITGVKRTRELIDRYGQGLVLDYAGALMDYSALMIRKTISKIPDGVYSFTDHLDDDGQGKSMIPISLNLIINGEEAVLDFSASSDQVPGCVNAVRSITLSCVLYVFRCLVQDDIPANSGCLRPLKVITRPGSIVDALFPSAVAGGNVETSQRIVDVILGALAKAMPGKIPAASQGTMNNTAIGGTNIRTGRAFTYYETIAGGMGASSAGDGQSAAHSHMTNTLNTPVEALEHSFPFLVRQYGLRYGSGGTGSHLGGDGLVREIEVLAPCEVTVLSERRLTFPYGLAGGKPGMCGQNKIFRNKEWIQMPGKFQEKLKPGDRLLIMTPGGGGYGPPAEE